MSETLNLIQHPGQGFFSCCSVLLDSIINYYNVNKKLPLAINTTNLFLKYNPYPLQDIFHNYFNIQIQPVIEYIDIIQHSESAQFEPFEHIKYSQIKPFINLYFSPSNTIKEIINIMKIKYSIDYDNTCVMFYRGLDKCTETVLPSYDEHFNEANKILNNNSNIRFLIQTDETEYLHFMLKNLERSFKFYEIRHINKERTSVDNVWTQEQNFAFSHYFLAIVYIMAKCKYVICNSGNISAWICYFRGNNTNVFQYLDTKFV